MKIVIPYKTALIVKTHYTVLYYYDKKIFNKKMNNGKYIIYT